MKTAQPGSSGPATPENDIAESNRKVLGATLGT